MGDAAESGRCANKLMQVARATAPAESEGDAAAAPCAAGDIHSLSNLFAGAYEHLIRLTLFRIWSTLGDDRAAPLRTEAHARVMAEADRIVDHGLRESFLTRIAEHRDIRDLAVSANERRRAS